MVLDNKIIIKKLKKNVRYRFEEISRFYTTKRRFLYSCVYSKLISKQLHIKANEFIRDVFENILINALLHNKSSIPEIDIKISKEQEDTTNYLKICFQDNGIGVGDARKERKLINSALNKTKFGLPFLIYVLLKSRLKSLLKLKYLILSLFSSLGTLQI